MGDGTGIIFNIQKFSIQDGPGLRTTVFFKGCNLRCRWCHNPESWSPQPQLLRFAEKCQGCGLCQAVCRQSCEPEGCSLCGDCAEVCAAGARSLCGKAYTVEALMAQIERDRPFYEKSGGGVTCSGGECMLQPDFLLTLLRACRRAGISTAVDTAGAVPFHRFETVAPETDLFLYDIKCFAADRHRAFTGVDNQLILDNYRRLLQRGCRVWVRIPLIPGFNDDPAELTAIRDFLARHRPERLDLLPYHSFGLSKHEAAGHGAAWHTRVPTEEEMTACRAVFKEADL